MMDMTTTRRALLKGTAVASAAAFMTPAALSGSARAAVAPAGKQAPGYYRFKVGDYEVTLLHDGAFVRPSQGFVTNVSQEQADAASQAAYMPPGKVTVPFNPTLINTGSKLVLIDTGYGPVPNAPVGQVFANLKAAGLDPKDIDILILSHLHPDHINGLRTADGGIAFPNAEIKAPAQEWAFWMSDDNMNKASGKMMQDYFANTRKILGGLENKITRYDWDKEVAPGVTALGTPGHTPGHTSFAVSSGSGRLLVQSDVTNIPEFFLRHPDWHVAYDVDPDVAAKTRHRFHDMAAAEKALIAGFHFSFPNAGHVEKDGAGYRLIPVAWSAAL
jgi:glyoxylase-like metal-dependent hydrolase (beta-lactamase superfamily II)